MLAFTPRVIGVEPWASKNSLPLPIADCANSCAAYGTFYYQWAGYSPSGDNGYLLKYSTIGDTWATRNARVAFLLHLPYRPTPRRGPNTCALPRAQ